MQKALILTIIFRLILGDLFGADPKENGKGYIDGIVKLDDSWDRKVYLSYIPTFEDMYSMSSQMILAKSNIDSTGHFKIDISFLPEQNQLLRLHISKKNDSPYSLVIGGKDENHLFLLASKHSVIELESESQRPPFRYVKFDGGDNLAFQQITDLVYRNDSIASYSTEAKRQFLENEMQRELLYMADTAKTPLVSLYAVYKSNFHGHIDQNKSFYNGYLEKWQDEDNDYFNAFRAEIPISATPANEFSWWWLVSAMLCVAVGIMIGKMGLTKNRTLKRLSVQERKIYELLKKGASNQEISDEFNIGISTVKSHISSIYTKLKVKSRKDLINMD
ncbi:helix-turn-helix domain-containing protein [Fulvivirga ligni]|uniref:helix-turn-helix domain-containing protein n=1 Tax=Fulvivirga ligni TaxID=2904246 RepID=UPI001F194C3A|nr:helix-turn-helix transcriptional regulator [Fulvivirga ligni]UII22313.1 helix-turn-helix transcriptional regulator [Fulvivirga ligni]